MVKPVLAQRSSESRVSMPPHRDVVGGLRLFREGHRSEAVWAWSFGFQTHWGEHATGAIRALHAWLAAEAPAGLGSGRPPRTSM